MMGNSCSDPPIVPLTGDLKQMTVPWLFQSMRTQSRTGTAVFEYIQGQTAESVVKKVYFRGGDITFAASNLAADRLGDRLLATGRLTRAQFDASTELIRKTGKKQGAILVELGFLTPQVLVESVKQQVKEIILSLFGVRMGTYRFDESPLPMADIIPLQMSTGNVILEGIAALEWEAVRRSLPSPTAVIRPASDPSCLFQDAHLTPDQQAVFALVDGKRSIEEICGLSAIGDFNALKAVYTLLALRMAEIGAAKTEREMEFAREVVRETVRSAAPRQEQPMAEEPSRPAEPEVVASREMIEQAYAALGSQDHYQLLGVTPASPLQEIKHAYFRLPKSYHPDRHFDPAMADMKPALETLFDRIHKAYSILSDQARRAEYDLAAARRAPAKNEFVEKRPEGYQEDYKEKAARAVEQFNNGLQDFKTGNYWGAEESFAWATRLDPIKAPYFYYHGLCLINMPRRRHEAEESLLKAIDLDPTRLEYHLELSNLYLKSGLKTKAIGVLNKALEHHPESPKVKDAIAAAGEGKLSAVPVSETAGRPSAARPMVSRDKAAQALQQFNKALKEFKVNNFGVAVEGFAAAVRLDPGDARYQYHYGYCLARIARRSNEAESSLKKALDLDATRPEHHLELGSYYLRTGQKAKALGILNNALLRFPENARIRDAYKAAGGAVQDVAAADGDQKGGLFRKIFREKS